MQSYIRAVGVLGLENVGMVAAYYRPDVKNVGSNIVRSAQPFDYQSVKDLGFKTILDLREADDTVAVEAVGLRYFSWPLTVLSDIEPDEFDKLIALITTPEYWPLLIHCTQGVDRTGTVCAAYRISQDGWSLEDALEEMEQYGAHEFMDAGLKACLQRYADHLKEKT